MLDLLSSAISCCTVPLEIRLTERLYRKEGDAAAAKMELVWQSSGTPSRKRTAQDKSQLQRRGLGC